MTGERLPDGDVDQIFKLTGIEEDLDGNIKYEGSFLHGVAKLSYFLRRVFVNYVFYNALSFSLS